MGEGALESLQGDFICAAATMIDKDGQHDLVAATAKSNNFIRLQNITEGPLLDWILTSGFTIEEIDRIQEPMTRDDLYEPDYKLPTRASRRTTQRPICGW